VSATFPVIEQAQANCGIARASSAKRLKRGHKVRCPGRVCIGLILRLAGQKVPIQSAFDKMETMQTLHLSTSERCSMVNITNEVADAVAKSGVRRGLCLIHAPHTTAGITVQEGYDPDVVRDILTHLEKNVPERGDYHHAEGNSDAHIKSLITGANQVLPIEYGKLQLGRWQAIFFCEFDGPRQRTVWIQIVQDDNKE
jgi:secondary thiamine-phosphate synthase enzyme